MKTKQELIAKVHEDSDFSINTIETIVQAFLETLREEIVQGNSVRVAELGTFKTATRKAHTGYNPATGEALPLPEKRVPQLRFNTAISRALNNKDAA